MNQAAQHSVGSVASVLALLDRTRAEYVVKIAEIDAAAGVLRRLDAREVEVSAAPIVVEVALTRTSAAQPRLGRRFTTTPEMNPEAVTGLPDDHPAIRESRSLFPGSVIRADQTDRVLVSGGNNRKLGDRIIKGPWKGMPLYHLTLEERATCPSSCFNWTTCYGNGMPKARRHKADNKPSAEALLAALRVELHLLQKSNPGGFVVRLHTLGDFYSTEYVNFWRGALDRFPALRVFGYTARERTSEIGAAILALTQFRWDRFAIRFSSAVPWGQGATTIFRKPEAPVVMEGIVCPAETGRTAACGSCGLCWNEAAKDKCIVFIAHGRSFGGAPRVDETAPPQGLGGGLPKAGLSHADRHEQHTTAIIAAIRSMQGGDERITGVRIAEKLEMPLLTIRAKLQRLKDENILDHTGSQRSTSWFVVERNQPIKAADVKVRGPGCTAVGCAQTRQPGTDFCAACHRKRLASRSRGNAFAEAAAE